MKIALIEPKPPGIHVYTRLNLPRLGLPLVGTIMKNQGHEVRIFCEDIAPIDWKAVEEADWVGISTTTSTTPSGYAYADKIRAKGKTVVMGGSHVTFMADEALQHCDYVVRGEGQDTIVELVQALENSSSVDGIAGLSYWKDGQIKHNADRAKTEDLNTLPFPDLSLINGREKMRITPIMTSWGCPFPCTFCSVTRMFGRGYRFRSTESVIAELKETKPKQIFFYDDNFTASRKRTKELLTKMLEENLIIPWSAQVRVDVVKDEEMLQLMKDTGCFKVYLGLESISPETLASFDKKQNVNDIVESIRLLHKYGITSHGMFVLGSDTDNADTVRDTVKFAKKNRIDTIQLGILTPLPGTPLYDDLDREERIFSKDWSRYDSHHVVFIPKHMSPYVLQRETNKGLQSFYSRRRAVRFLLNRSLANAFFLYYGHTIAKRFIKGNKAFRANLKKVFGQRRTAEE